MTTTFRVNGRTITLQPPSDTLTARVCVVCQKPRKTMAIVVQDDEGVMHSTFFHLPCFQKLVGQK